MPLKTRLKHILKAIGRSEFVLSLIASLGYIYTWLVGKTGKFDIQGIDKFADTVKANHGAIMVSWHGRALMLPYFGKSIPRPAKALVSPHADGRIIAKILKKYHIDSIDGSSDRRAAAAAVEIVEELKNGTMITLISDGPRGPRMRLNKSAIYFAKKSGKPLIGMTYSSEDAIVMNSWDAMLMPKLFKKGIVKCSEPFFVPQDADEETMERLRKQFEDILNNMTFTADMLCGLPQILPQDTVKPRGKRNWGAKHTFFIRIYQLLMTGLFPILKATYIKKRQKSGKESPTRFNERLGQYTKERPQGKLFWMHGASVGEAISMLPLIDKLLAEDKNLSILVTTGTITSAEIMGKRLPERAFHQFIPFDVPKFAKSLLKHFRPDAALWFESELWPSLLFETKRRGIPLILVNGRISDKSFKHWLWFKPIIREIFACFSMLIGQSEQDKERLQLLSSLPAKCVGNIKYAGKPLPIDEDTLQTIQTAVGSRKVFLISSTHDDEEAQLATHLSKLQQQIPDILTIVVPRHPHRGTSVTEIMKTAGFNTAQRSIGEQINADTTVYIADTIGEMGLWYKLADISFVGGSLIPHGGQNFIEPARDKNAIIVGPFTHNFTEMIARATATNAVIQVNSAEAVINQAIALYSNPSALLQQQQAAYAWTIAENKVLDNLCTALNEELAP